MKNAMIIFGLIYFSLLGSNLFAESDASLVVTAKMDRLQKEGEQAYYRSEYAKAVEKWEQGLELAKTSRKKKYIGQFLGNIGLVYSDFGQYEKALAYYKQALAINREIGARRGEGGDLSNIGGVYWNLGQYEKALSYYNRKKTNKYSLFSIRYIFKSKHKNIFIT